MRRITYQYKYVPYPHDINENNIMRIQVEDIKRKK